MAMLAEPRRKQKIGPNPRGKFFLEDEDNKGRAMLSKLGWQKGDGLGRQNQGMQAPICPKIQMDGKGLGYDPKSDPWIAHTEEFSQILENLQSVHAAQAEVTFEEPLAEDEAERKRKLEKKSKSSKVRIHYHKFVKNKDVSNFSNTDLKCIFGKPSDALLEKPALEGDSVKAESAENESAEDGMKTINCGSMADYFKKKMEEKGKKVEVKVENHPSEENPNIINRGSMIDYFKAKMAERRLKALQTEQEQSPVEHVELKEESVNSEGTGSSLAEEAPNSESPKKKRKKDKKEKFEDSPDVMKPEITNGYHDIDMTCAVDSVSPIIEENLSKKRKKSKEVDSENQFEVDVKPVISEVQEFSETEPVKKSKKSKKNKSKEQEPEIKSSENLDPVCSMYENHEAKKSENSKRKVRLEADVKTTAEEPPLKKSKHMKPESETTLEDNFENDIVQSVSKTEKRKKVRKQIDDVSLNIAQETEATEIQKEKKKKSKRLPEETENGMQNIAQETEATEIQKEKKKKSKRLPEETENGMLDIAQETEATEIKKEKKKKAKQNPEETQDGSQEIAQEAEAMVGKKEKKKKAKQNLEETQDGSQEIAQEAEATEIKKEKKKKAKQNLEETQDGSQEIAQEAEATEIKKEKKKKAKQNLEETQDGLQEIAQEAEAKLNKKERKKKSKGISEEINGSKVEIKEEALKTEPSGNTIPSETNIHKFPKSNPTPAPSFIPLVKAVKVDGKLNDTSTHNQGIHKPPKSNNNNAHSENSLNNPQKSINNIFPFKKKLSKTHPTPVPSYIPRTKDGKVDKYNVTPKSLNVVSRNFPGSNLNKLKGYALY